MGLVMQSGEHILGIAGMTPGGVGIWVGVIGLFAWWIRGKADRMRASNEGVTVESKATDAVIEQLRKEVSRMSDRIEKLEHRVDELETENKSVVGERDAALAENARLRAINQGQGEVRQQAAAIVAVDRLEARGRGVRK